MEADVFDDELARGFSDAGAELESAASIAASGNNDDDDDDDAVSGRGGRRRLPRIPVSFAPSPLISLPFLLFFSFFGFVFSKESHFSFRLTDQYKKINNK